MATATYTQLNRRIAVSTPLGDDVLLLQAFDGSDGISEPFRYHLDLLSIEGGIDIAALIGAAVTVRISLADQVERYFNGIISRFAQGGRYQDFTTYQAEMVPWLWLLTRVADCRIFQHKTVPDIIKQIFTERGLQDFSMAKLEGPFPERDYCVQYRETDFNFISRLLEEEGIFYFFSHENGKHTLILANTADAHPDCPHQAVVKYHHSGSATRSGDIITEWTTTQHLRTGRYTLNEFNFEDPSAPLVAKAVARNALEIYDYPGIYARAAEGQRLARIRLEESNMPEVTIQGGGDCRDFTSGYKFQLAEHDVEERNQIYLLTRVHHSASQSADERSASDPSAGAPVYHNRFECIPFSTPFRPPRTAPKPVVQGSQTAIVVGPAGEEIHTDRYGRIKVQFHWDREHSRDEKSSCWIRVAQPWAGQNWGAVAIPRIGQEVVVDFLEGDPDRPIVTGSVYNAEQMPPYALPAAAHTMGFKSNSTKGGGGYNEIVIEDGKGNELLRLHAQKDMQATVEHNDTQNVKADRTIRVGGKHDEQVKKSIVIKSAEDQIYIEAATQITLVVGKSKLCMNSDGIIQLEGVHVTVVGSSMIDLNPQAT